MDEPSPSTVRTTETTLRIIEELQSMEGARLSELEDHLELARSTIHGHLQTLLEHGYLLKEGEVYHLGFRFFNLGEHTKKRDERFQIVERRVRQLADETSEEVDFSVVDHGRTIVIFDEVGSGAHQGFQVGDYFYMNTNAAGKAILAEYPRARVEEVLDTWGLPAETDATITDREELFAELERTRERGYAINNEENFDGIRAIGTAVSAQEGSPFGALAISGPAYRLTEQELEDLSDRLLSYTRELEDELRSPTVS